MSQFNSSSREQPRNYESERPSHEHGQIHERMHNEAYDQWRSNSSGDKQISNATNHQLASGDFLDLGSKETVYGRTSTPTLDNRKADHGNNSVYSLVEKGNSYPGYVSRSEHRREEQPESILHSTDRKNTNPDITITNTENHRPDHPPDSSKGWDSIREEIEQIEEKLERLLAQLRRSGDAGRGRRDPDGDGDFDGDHGRPHNPISPPFWPVEPPHRPVTPPIGIWTPPLPHEPKPPIYIPVNPPSFPDEPEPPTYPPTQPPSDGGNTPPSDGGNTPPSDGGNTPPSDKGTDLSSIFSRGDSGVSQQQLQHAIDLANALPEDMKKGLLAAGVKMTVDSGFNGGAQGSNNGRYGTFYADSGMADQAEIHELYEMYGQTVGGAGSWGDQKGLAMADACMSTTDCSSEGDLNDTVGRVKGDGDHMSNAFVADFFATHPDLLQDTYGRSVLQRVAKNDPALLAYIAQQTGMETA